MAVNEAQKLGHNYIGMEHLLLGLASEGTGIAANVLAGFDFNLDRARQIILDTLKKA